MYLSVGTNAGEEAIKELISEVERTNLHLRNKIYVDATPDEELPVRILEAHIDEGEWSDNAGGFPSNSQTAKILNEAQAERNKILREAISKIGRAEYWERMYAIENERVEKASAAFRRTEAHFNELSKKNKRLEVQLNDARATAARFMEEAERFKSALEVAVVAMASVWPDDFLSVFSKEQMEAMMEKNHPNKDFDVERLMYSVLFGEKESDDE